MSSPNEAYNTNMVDPDDPTERMDLVYNAELCSVLLDCWDEATKMDKGQSESSTGSRTPSNIEHNRLWEGGSNDGNGVADLQKFLMEDADFSGTSKFATSAYHSHDQDDTIDDQSHHEPHHIDTSSSTTASSTAPSLMTPTSRNNAPAEKPASNAAASASAKADSVQLAQSQQAQRPPEATSKLHPQGITSSADCPPHHVAAFHQATAAGFPMSFSTGGQLNHLFMQPQVAINSATANVTANNTGLQQQQQQQDVAKQHQPESEEQRSAASRPQHSSHQFNTHHHTSSSTKSPNRRPQPPPQQQQQPQQASPPPFLLFDAPMELRANFLQSQRQHGISVIQQDNNSSSSNNNNNNSFQYGMAVNGFHPQQSCGNAVSSQSSSNNMMFAGGDSRSNCGNDPVSKRAKNAKEQKRAQQITNLIEQLRVKMEKDGWKVELKSKFHTLSSCADYVKHLVKSNKEKEEAIERAKLDLQAKRRQIQEDKAQQDPSDPESTTSDLTESSASANSHPHSNDNCNTNEEGDESGNFGDRSTKRKKARLLPSQESTVSSSTSSGGDDQANQAERPTQAVSADQTSMSVSDVTDSNKGSSRNSNDDKEESNVDTMASVSSDAAVASGTTHHRHLHQYADVVIQGGEKRRSRPNPLKDDCVTTFRLDYEEVFVKSNVPQILSTPAGKVISWNEFFLKATGLKAKEVKKLTIFSLVKTQNLASLFEIVAAALRTGSIEQPSETEGNPSSENTGSVANAEKKSGDFNYSAITLPCVFFPKCIADGRKRQLYMTVTLMTDEDPLKRCFHCVFTDNPGTNGSLGSVTPELLSLLFTTAPSPDGNSRRKRKAQH